MGGQTTHDDCKNEAIAERDQDNSHGYSADSCVMDNEPQTKTLTSNLLASDAQLHSTLNGGALIGYNEEKKVGSSGTWMCPIHAALEVLAPDAPVAESEIHQELFGISTQAAVKQFQRDNCLNDDGVIGPTTLALMDQQLADRDLDEYIALQLAQTQLTSSPQGGEWESMEAFTESTGESELGPGQWLASDRKKRNQRWKSANEYNLQQPDGHLAYNTITQRTEFYGWFQKEIEKMGHETKWAGAAYIIAQQMSLMDEALIAFMTPDEAIAFANEGNKAIFDDVFDNLRNLYNGPIKKGQDAQKWDEETLTHEQRDVVQPIYERQTEETIEFLEDLAKGRGWRAFAGYAFDRRFPIGGPLKFEGDLMNWRDRYDHGMEKAVPFYEKHGSIFNWNKPGDGRLDGVLDPDNPGLRKPGEY